MTVVKTLYVFEKMDNDNHSVFTIAANNLQDAWDLLLALKETVEGWRWIKSEPISD